MSNAIKKRTPAYAPPKYNNISRSEVMAALTVFVTDPPINQLTDRKVLNAYIVLCRDSKDKWQHHPLSEPYKTACAELLQAKKRLQWLDRLKVTTLPVTPQLNLF